MPGLRLIVCLVLLIGGCSAPSPTLTLSHFATDGIRFDYPAPWQAATFDQTPDLGTLIVLSTEPLSDPCKEGPSEVDCGGSPIAGKLPVNGFVAAWRLTGLPGWAFNPSVGESIRVGGVQSTLQVLNAGSPGGCSILAGQTQVQVTAPIDSGHSWQFGACINGSFDGPIESQIRAMLASVAWG